MPHIDELQATARHHEPREACHLPRWIAHGTPTSPCTSYLSMCVCVRLCAHTPSQFGHVILQQSKPRLLPQLRLDRHETSSISSHSLFCWCWMASGTTWSVCVTDKIKKHLRIFPFGWRCLPSGVQEPELLDHRKKCNERVVLLPRSLSPQTHFHS